MMMAVPQHFDLRRLETSLTAGTRSNRPKAGRPVCAVQAFSTQAKTLAQGEFTSPEHFDFSRYPKKQPHLLVWLFLCRGQLKPICSSSRDFQPTHPTGLLAGGAFAPYKRFRPRRKPWRRANSLRPSILIPQGIQKNNHTFWCGCFFGASDEARTRYLHLGKVALYQMSYTRNSRVYISRFFPRCQLLFSISSTFFFPEQSRSSSARNSGSSSRGRYQ